jgi:hypothetical protein
MSAIVEIYIALLEECVDVWRPVKAESLGDGRYRILEQHYDSEAECWQFRPGDVVYCEMIESSDGRILAATRKVVGSTAAP